MPQESKMERTTSHVLKIHTPVKPPLNQKWIYISLVALAAGWLVLAGLFWKMSHDISMLPVVSGGQPGEKFTVLSASADGESLMDMLTGALNLIEDQEMQILGLDDQLDLDRAVSEETSATLSALNETMANISEAVIATIETVISLNATIGESLDGYLVASDLTEFEAVANSTTIEIGLLTEELCKQSFSTARESWWAPDWVYPEYCGELGPLCLSGETAHTDYSDCLNNRTHATLFIDGSSGADNHVYTSPLDGKSIYLMGPIYSGQILDFTGSTPSHFDIDDPNAGGFIITSGPFTITNAGITHSNGLLCSGTDYYATTIMDPEDACAYLEFSTTTTDVINLSFPWN